MKITLKQVREQLNMTQVEAAKQLGVSRRSYQAYEAEKKYQDTFKYRYMLKTLQTLLEDENQGILSINDIKRACDLVLSNYDVSYCYLFGSYAKGSAREDSDIDLLIATSVSGLKFFGLVEEIRQALHKRVDVIELSQLEGNKELLNEILMYGIKIYGNDKG